MRTGLQLNSTQRVFRWPELRELANTAEEAGLDSIWTEDHLFYQLKGRWLAPWDAWTILAGLAEATERITIGTMVSPMGMRHPVLLARHAAAVQELSGGRLVLGIGLGHGEPEYRALGLSREHRFGRFREGFAVLLQALETGMADLRGRYVTAEDFRLLPRPEDFTPPRLMIGSDGPRTLRLTLPHVGAWNWDGFANRPDEFAAASRHVDEVCREVGRDPGEIARTAHVIVRLPDAQGLPIDPLPPEVPLISGSVEEVAAGFAAFAEAGADELMVLLDPATPKAVRAVAAASAMTD